MNKYISSSVNKDHAYKWTVPVEGEEGIIEDQEGEIKSEFRS